MSNLIEKKVLKGLTVEKKDNGTWLRFEVNGKHADINIESKFSNTKIIKETLLDWADSQLYIKPNTNYIGWNQ